MKTWVLNGWAADAALWEACTFPRVRLFSYLDQVEGLPERELDSGDGGCLVGFSMGGNYALKLFLERREKVKSLVLVSTTARMMEDRAAGWQGLREHRLAALRLGTILANRDRDDALFDVRNLDRGLDYLGRADWRERLLSVPRGERLLPVRIFHSRRDGIVHPANADWLGALFPNSRVTMVEGGEHALPAKIPGAIDAAVRELSGEA